jgi:hypothetical protein
MIAPHRKDGYRPRSRVHVRIDDVVVNKIDVLATSLCLSRAHLCDLVLGIAVEEGGPWLHDCISRRVRRSLELRRSMWNG